MPGRFIYTFVLCLLFILISNAQNDPADQKKILREHPDDTLGLKAYLDLSEKCTEDSIPLYTGPGLELADLLLQSIGSEDKNILLLKSKLYTNQAYFLEYKGDITGAIHTNMQSLSILEKLDNKEALSVTLNNIGILYSDELNYKKALDYFQKSLQLRKELGDRERIANVMINIGSVHQHSHHYDSALYYYQMAGQLIDVKIAPSLLANTYNNLGTLYNKKGELDTSLLYLRKALTIYEEFDKSRMPVCLVNIADIYRLKGDLKNAAATGEESYALALKVGRTADIATSADELRIIYSSAGNYEKALFYFEEFKKRQDSLVNDEAKQALTRAQMQYEYDKKTAINELRRKEKEAVAAEEQRKLGIIIYSVSIGLILLLVLSVYIIKGYREKKRQHLEISEQKKVLEEKQKEILDSIRYAKRIQNSFLPTEKYIAQKIKYSER
jgi:tetratricopeptide (TPR) repeat protein